MVSDAEDLKWLASAAVGEIEEGLFFPVFQKVLDKYLRISKFDKITLRYYVNACDL